MITERSFGAAASGREDRLASSAIELVGGAEPTLERLVGILSEHSDPGFDGTCVHVPEWGYGTRSSTVFRLGPHGELTFRFAEGAPCETEYRDLSAEAVEALTGLTQRTAGSSTEQWRNRDERSAMDE